MAKNIKKEIKTKKQVSYLGKDFDSLRSDLIRFASTHYADKIADFTENGFGGMMIDMAAYVGDVMSYYMDHQFNELDLRTAIQDDNVEKLITAAGLDIVGASPSNVIVDFVIKVPAAFVENEYVPQNNLLPIIREGTVLGSSVGVNFTLMEDLDFRKTDKNGKLLASYEIFASSNGVPTSFVLKLQGACTSGQTFTETFNIDSTFTPFRTITLTKTNVTEILLLKDSDGNQYYEVDNLTQDVVFLRKDNLANDVYEVPERIEMTPAPYRFVKEFTRANNTTKLRFGSGRQDVFDDDVIPDPSEYSLPLYGSRKTFESVAIDPNKFLETGTFGISPLGTTLTVRYRHGGGLSHNVPALSINSVRDLIADFPSSTLTTEIVAVRGSLQVVNQINSRGGENSPSLQELRFAALSSPNSQMRIVSKQDLLARVYTMPNKFGRVYRAAVRPNRNNPLAALLYVVSRNSGGNLVGSPDTLKENLATYLNHYRLVSDAIDILDSPICNIAVEYSVSVERGYNLQSVLGQINFGIANYLKVENFQIDQPIILADIVNIIINTDGVLSLLDIRFTNKSGVDSNTGNVYSGFTFNIDDNTSKGLIYPANGGIFELRYPNFDIVGSAA